MAKAFVVNIPITLPEPALDGRCRVSNMDDDDNDSLGAARGLILGVLIGSSMWGAIGSIVWLLLDW